MKKLLAYIVLIRMVYGCQSKASEETVSYSYSSEDSHVASSASTTAWLSNRKSELLKEYNQQKSYEAKARVLKKFERSMTRKIQNSFHAILDSVTVRVDDVDTTIRSLYYIRFCDSLADYSYSTATQNLKQNPKTFKLVRSLKKGATATLNFRVRSLKVNDPSSPLATFEMEAVPLPLK